MARKALETHEVIDVPWVRVVTQTVSSPQCQGEEKTAETPSVAILAQVEHSTSYSR